MINHSIVIILSLLLFMIRVEAALTERQLNTVIGGFAIGIIAGIGGLIG